MTRRERYQVPRLAIPPWTVIYRNTTHLLWRDLLFWIEGAMLTVLTALAAVATAGSPNPGDAAIQMTAIAYAVAPFFLVLVVGQLTLRAETEAAWWSRPVSRGDYYFGRFSALVVLGLALLGYLAIVGGITSALITHLPVLPSLTWNLGLMLGFSLSSLVFVAGFSLWLAEISGGGHRYYPLAIFLALAVAFGEYKLPTLVASAPRLPFFNPFPAFLSLGLTMPPPLLGAPALPGWLLINRAGWAVIGLGFLVLAMVHRRGLTRHYLPTTKTPQVLAILIAAGLLGTTLAYGPTVAGLSPRVAPIRISSGSWLLTRPAQVSLNANASTGVIQGRERIHVPRYGTLPQALWLNRGLRIQTITAGGRSLDWRLADHGKIAVGSAARVYILGQAPGFSGGWLVIRYQGRLLPDPSPLAYAPFTPTDVYESLALGHGRLFLDGPRTWFPVPMLRTRHGFESLPVRGSFRLHVAHLTASDAIITNLHRDRKNDRWSGSLTHPVFEAAPYRSRNIGSFHLFHGSQGLPGKQRASYRVYAALWPSVSRILGADSDLTVVESPVTIPPSLEDSLLVISGVHPYATPDDPILDDATQPSSLEAKLVLATLWWQGRLAQLGTYAWQSQGMQPQTLGPGLSVLTVLASDPASLRRALYHQVKRDQPLPFLGTLSPGETRFVLTLAPLARTASAGAWARTFRRLPIAWPGLDQPRALAQWIVREVQPG